MSAVTPRRALLAAAVSLVALAGCGPDGPDVYSEVVAGVPAETRLPRTLPSTTVADPAAAPPEAFPPNGEVVQV
ncbi:MAG: hypothetical protein ACR2O6_02375, partial [Ilumatobacteraceae bacterium]